MGEVVAGNFEGAKSGAAPAAPEPPTQIVDVRISGGTPPGDGGGTLEGRVSLLEHRVGFHNKALGWMFVTGLAAIVISFLMLSSRIESASDKSEDRTIAITQQLSNFQTDTARNFERILVRLPNDQPQGSQGAQPPRPVRERARSRAGRR